MLFKRIEFGVKLLVDVSFLKSARQELYSLSSCLSQLRFESKTPSSIRTLPSAPIFHRIIHIGARGLIYSDPIDSTAGREL
jgi:hypothetical protein